MGVDVGSCLLYTSQLVSYVLGECGNVNEVKEKLQNIRVTNIDPRSSTVHWRFTEPSGRQIVLEIVDEIMHFYENPLGVLTNSPGLEWHWTNLNNYINLQPGTPPEHNYGPLQMKSFGPVSYTHLLVTQGHLAEIEYPGPTVQLLPVRSSVTRICYFSFSSSTRIPPMSHIRT